MPDQPPDTAPTVPDLGAFREQRADWLSTTELADTYGLSVATLRYWRHIGYGPASFALGRKVFYRRADVTAWIELQQKNTRRGGTAAA